MKKGQKLREDAYIVQVKDIHNKTVIGGQARSLREAVKMAGNYVVDMDNYSKVYREFNIMRGAYAGVFFAKHKGKADELAIMGRKPSAHLFVLIKQASLPAEELKFSAGDMEPSAEGTFLGDIQELLQE